MKTFTLTQSQSKYTLYLNQRFLSVTVSGSTFGSRQLLIEERGSSGSWSLAHGAPILAADHDTFTFAAKQLGQRIRFKAVGGGACNIVISVSESPNLATAFIPTGGGSSIEAEDQESRDYEVGELFYYSGSMWRVTVASLAGETPATNPEKFEQIGGSEDPTPQVVTSSSNILQWDHTLGSSAKLTLTEDVYNIIPDNAAEGDSGLIIVEQDGTSNWTLNDAINSRVLAGDLAVIGADMTSATMVCTVGWYLGEGNIKYLYVSDVADQTI